MNIEISFRLILKEQNISQSELARKLNISRGSINKNLIRWENGKIPTLKTLKKWCSALNTDYKNFLKYL